MRHRGTGSSGAAHAPINGDYQSLDNHDRETNMYADTFNLSVVISPIMLTVTSGR